MLKLNFQKSDFSKICLNLWMMSMEMTCLGIETGSKRMILKNSIFGNK